MSGIALRTTAAAAMRRAGTALRGDGASLMRDPGSLGDPMGVVNGAVPSGRSASTMFARHWPCFSSHLLKEGSALMKSDGSAR